MKEVDEWFGKNTRAAIDAAARARLAPITDYQHWREKRFADGKVSAGQKSVIGKAYHQRRLRIIKEIYDPEDQR